MARRGTKALPKAAGLFASTATYTILSTIQNYVLSVIAVKTGM